MLPKAFALSDENIKTLIDYLSILRKFMTRLARQLALPTTVFCCFLFLLPTYAVYAQSLGKPKIKAEIQKLDTTCANTNQKAIKTLRQASKESVPFLIEVLKNNQNTKLQASAAWALGQISVESKAVDALINALKNQNEPVRLQAVEALANISGNNVDITLQNKNAVSALIALIKQDTNNEDIQVAAIFTLGNIETKGKAAIPILREKLNINNT
ncbi:MAG: HEAT repeat domain-containing protein [Nostoc sp.]|uniref:HEAT repeat domain-containing protein n=1 Tax=Nostoc sp. TaxID=1180 RepID=UPI002FF6A56A